MSQLAYNYKGQRFTPPAEAMFWRVRRLREGQRGQLDVVRGPDGRPLIVPIDVDVEGFRLAVNDQVGRYRLDALDEHEVVLASVDAAYVTVPTTAPRAEADEGDVPEVVASDNDRRALARGAAMIPEAREAATVTAPFGTWPALPMPTAMTGTEYLLAEALRGQVQMFQMVTAALANQGATAAAGASQMMGAAAELVRAADGAAMPRRPPPPSPPPSGGRAPSLPPIVLAAPGSVAARNAAPTTADDWEEDADAEADESEGEGAPEEEGAAGDADVFAKMLTLADKVQGVIAPVADVARLVMGGMGGGLRNATPDDEATEEGDDEEMAEAATPTAPAHLRTSHILLIAHELGEDGSLFRQVLMAMDADDRNVWTERLCSMPFEEAVEDVATKLARIKERQVRDRAATALRGADQVADRERRSCGDGDGDTCAGHPPGDPAGDDTREDQLEAAPDDDATEDRECQDDPGEDTATATHAADRDGGIDDAPDTTDAVDEQPSLPTAAPSPSPAAVQARMMEIAKHLRVPEILQAQQLIKSLAVTERDAWIARLMSLTPGEAATVVRAELRQRR